MNDLSEIDKLISSLDEEIKSVEERENLMTVMRLYQGDEEIVSSSDYISAMARLRGNTDIFKVYTGIKGLDLIAEGFMEGNVVVISGPTKEGKTTLCQTLTINFDNLYDEKTLWFPFDTPGEEVIQRFNGKVDIYLPKKNPSVKKLDWVEKKIIEGIAKYGTRIIFIDHLAMLTRATDNERNYSTELSSIMMELKQIAIRWRVIIFLNHHIRKIQADVVPMYSDLKDSAGVAQDSDMVIMVWRKKEKKGGIIFHTNKATLSVQTNRRTGRTGVVEVNHCGDHFEEETFSEIIETNEVKSTEDL